jgi:hypothetical protein
VKKEEEEDEEEEEKGKGEGKGKGKKWVRLIMAGRGGIGLDALLLKYR